MTGKGRWGIPKRAFDATASSRLTPAEKLIVHVLLRWTHGHYHQEAVEMPAARLSALTGLTTRTVGRCLIHLREAGVVVRSFPGVGRRGDYYFVADPRDWRQLRGCHSANFMCQPVDNRQPSRCPFLNLNTLAPTLTTPSTDIDDISHRQNVATTGTARNSFRSTSKGRAPAESDDSSRERTACPNEGAFLTADWDGELHCPICDWRPPCEPAGDGDSCPAVAGSVAAGAP